MTNQSNTKVQVRSGTWTILKLPEGYDERTSLSSFEEKVIVVHPDFPLCYIEDGKLVEVKL